LQRSFIAIAEGARISLACLCFAQRCRSASRSLRRRRVLLYTGRAEGAIGGLLDGERQVAEETVGAIACYEASPTG
jgi:hypothetical protein